MIQLNILVSVQPEASQIKLDLECGNINTLYDYFVMTLATNLILSQNSIYCFIQFCQLKRLGN